MLTGVDVVRFAPAELCDFGRGINVISFIAYFSGDSDHRLCLSSVF